MIRTLDSQAQAIWPQERDILSRQTINEPTRILDLGSGTGIVSNHIANLFPKSAVMAIDVLSKMIEFAKERYSSTNNLEFKQADGLALPFLSNTFDLVVSRHVLQIIPNYRNVLEEIVRVLSPGGRIHILAEDYGMIHFDLRRLDPEEFWKDGPINLGRALNTEMKIGRRLYNDLSELGFREIAIDYVTVDTLRVPRNVFADIWSAWRDGYTEILAANSKYSEKEVEVHWNEMIDCINDPKRYAVWQIPIYSALLN